MLTGLLETSKDTLGLSMLHSSKGGRKDQTDY